MAKKDKKNDPFKTFKEFFGNQKWVSSVEKQFEHQIKHVIGSFDNNFKKAISRFNLVTSKDVEKLERRISNLEKKLPKSDKLKKAAARKTAAKKSPSSKKPTTSKSKITKK